MGDTARRNFDLEIRDLSEPYVDETARIHVLCFPEKLEAKLGVDCIADCLRRRYVSPGGDCFSRIAIDSMTGRVAGYCHGERLVPGSSEANMFLGLALARKYLRRRIWLRPGVWVWVTERVLRKFSRRVWNEGDALQVLPNWEVAKMLGIHPDYRGGNVGKALMLDNELQARRRGSDRICGLVKQSNIKAERLYASVGWVRSSSDSRHYDVFAMHRDLTESAAAPLMTREAPVTCTLPTFTSTSPPETRPRERARTK